MVNGKFDQFVTKLLDTNNAIRCEFKTDTLGSHLRFTWRAIRSSTYKHRMHMAHARMILARMPNIRRGYSSKASEEPRPSSSESLDPEEMSMDEWHQ